MRNENFGRPGTLVLVLRGCAGGAGANAAGWRPVAWSRSGGSRPWTGERVSDHRTITSYLIDMDGVLVHEDQPIPGADKFVKAHEEKGLRYLVITNNSIFTQRHLSARLALAGIRLPPELASSPPTPPRSGRRRAGRCRRPARSRR